MKHTGKAGAYGATVSYVAKGSFQALAQGRYDYTLGVIHRRFEGYGDVMAICATNEVIYISKEQVLAFFGIKELTS